VERLLRVFLVDSRTGRVPGRDYTEHPVEFGVEGRIGREGRQGLAGRIAWRVDPAEAEPAGEVGGERAEHHGGSVRFGVGSHSSSNAISSSRSRAVIRPSRYMPRTAS
jgi:hypothetical protein